MSKGKGHKGADPKRDERRRAQFAAMQQRAATEPAPQRREHIAPVEMSGDEGKYQPLLYAIESGLLVAYQDSDGLIVDDEAERALRLLIARYEGDTERRSGSADVDAMADRVHHNVEALFQREGIISRAEIIGGLRRIIESVRLHHDPANPRAYFAFIGDFFPAPEEPYPDTVQPSSSGLLWTPGAPAAPPPVPEPARRPSGLWLPGDKS